MTLPPPTINAPRTKYGHVLCICADCKATQYEQPEDMHGKPQCRSCGGRFLEPATREVRAKHGATR